MIENTLNLVLCVGFSGPNPLAELGFEYWGLRLKIRESRTTTRETGVVQEKAQAKARIWPRLASSVPNRSAAVWERLVTSPSSTETMLMNSIEIK